jgi:hypothetical protein
MTKTSTTRIFNGPVYASAKSPPCWFVVNVNQHKNAAALVAFVALHIVEVISGTITCKDEQGKELHK